MNIIAIDPGKSTGVCEFVYENGKCKIGINGTIKYPDRFKTLSQIFNRQYDIIVIEQYVIFASTQAQHVHVHQELWGPKVISVVETLTYQTNQFDKIKFYAPIVKNNLEVPKEVVFRGERTEHVKDAYKLCLYWHNMESHKYKWTQ